MKNGQLQHLNPWQKLAFFFAAMFFAFFLAQLITEAAAKFLLSTDHPREIVRDLTRVDSIRMTKISNLTMHLFGFILPAIFLTKLFNFEPKQAITFKAPSKSYWLAIPLLFLCITSLNEVLSILNHQIDFSFVSKSFQESLEYQQAVQSKVTFAYIGETWKSYFFNLVLIALVPAVSEELVFRGILQNLISKATQNVWIGIVSSALLFALLHGKPFHFIPILGLGILYGVIVAYSGSIWLTMILHFANNALVLSIPHFSKMYNLDPINLSILVYMSIILISGIILFLLVKTNVLPSKWNETKGIYFR